MSQGSAQTRQEILASARAEFLAHGFANASLRTIAAGAGVTTGALYRHFADKDALFAALVEPAYTGLQVMFRQETDRHIHLLGDQGVEGMFRASQENIFAILAYIYENLDAFRLLLSASEHSIYEDFLHTIIDLEVDMTLRYLEEAKNGGHIVGELSRQELHMLSNAQFSALFELVHHNVPAEKARAYMKTVYRFFTAGWRDLLLGT